MKYPDLPESILFRMCRMFQLGESTSTASAVTGEPYVTLVSGGIKPEGAAAPSFATEDEAWEKFWKSFLAYVEPFDRREHQVPKACIYLRSLPHMHEVTVDSPRPSDGVSPHVQYRVRCRLLISDKFYGASQ